MPPKILIPPAILGLIAWCTAIFTQTSRLVTPLPSGDGPLSGMVFDMLKAPSTPSATDLGPLGNANTLMQFAISLLLLGAALWVVLARRYAATDRHWAYGAIGTIVGFWLHT